MPSTRLPIQTVYYRGRTVVKINRAGTPLNAIAWAVIHMRRNHYEATHVEAFDIDTGKLHSVMRLSVNGSLHIVFERKQEPEE